MQKENDGVELTVFKRARISELDEYYESEQTEADALQQAEADTLQQTEADKLQQTEADTLQQTEADTLQQTEEMESLQENPTQKENQGFFFKIFYTFIKEQKSFTNTQLTKREDFLFNFNVSFITFFFYPLYTPLLIFFNFMHLLTIFLISCFSDLSELKSYSLTSLSFFLIFILSLFLKKYLIFFIMAYVISLIFPIINLFFTSLNFNLLIVQNNYSNSYLILQLISIFIFYFFIIKFIFYLVYLLRRNEGIYILEVSLLVAGLVFIITNITLLVKFTFIVHYTNYWISFIIFNMLFSVITCLFAYYYSDNTVKSSLYVYQSVLFILFELFYGISFIILRSNFVFDPLIKVN